MMMQIKASKARNPLSKFPSSPLVYAMPAATNPRKIPTIKHHSEVEKLRLIEGRAGLGRIDSVCLLCERIRIFSRSRNDGFGSVRSIFRRISSISRSYLLGMTGTPRYTGRAGMIATRSASAVFATIIPHFAVLHKHA